MISGVVYRKNTGHIIGGYTVPFENGLALQCDETTDYVIVATLKSADNKYVVDGKLVGRTHITPMVSQFEILDDGVSETSVVFPEGTTVEIDGVQKHSATGLLTFQSTTAGRMLIQPGKQYQFDPITINVATLASYQDAKWEQTKVIRQAKMDGGVVTPWGMVDSDATAKTNISGSVQLAMLAQAAGEPFEIEWTMKDNSEATLDAAAMISIGSAVGAHIAACHERGRVLRMEIFAATTMAELEAVDIESGWWV